VLVPGEAVPGGLQSWSQPSGGKSLAFGNVETACSPSYNLVNGLHMYVYVNLSQEALYVEVVNFNKFYI
jgi:hypothetical protein